MATLMQHLNAFFDPTVAINEEGYLVSADGLFDSGKGSTDYIENGPNLSTAKKIFYGNTGPWSYGNSDGFAPNDTGAIDQYLEEADTLYDKLIDSAKAQNEAAQSSADRAMEFNKNEAQLARDSNAEQARINRDWQAAQNQKAMDYSERMANTQYQRAVADLQAAGLNPKLAAKLGGAAAPSGVTSSGSAASGSAASGSAANITAANLSPLASVLSSYITGADALDRQNNDFVQRMIGTLLTVAFAG